MVVRRQGQQAGRDGVRAGKMAVQHWEQSRQGLLVHASGADALGLQCVVDGQAALRIVEEQGQAQEKRPVKIDAGLLRAGQCYARKTGQIRRSSGSALARRARL